MPLVKVIRNGQITLPKKLRRLLGIEDGDLLEIRVTKSGMEITPQSISDKKFAGNQLSEPSGLVPETGQGGPVDENATGVNNALQVVETAELKIGSSSPERMEPPKPVKTALHYNYSLHPDQNILPMCRVGSIGGKDGNFSHWRATTDKDQVTCRRCLKLLGVRPAGEAPPPATDWGPYAYKRKSASE